MEIDILKEVIIVILVLVLLVMIAAIIIIQGKGKKNKIKEEKDYKSMSSASLKNLEEKRKQNKELLEKEGYKVYRELISPVEAVSGKDCINVVIIDFVNFNMALTHLSTSSKLILPKKYDIRNLTEVNLIINGKKDNGELEYEDGIKSIKIDITAKDVYNPKYFIALLPKPLKDKDVKFDNDYLLYARAITKELEKVVHINRV